MTETPPPVRMLTFAAWRDSAPHAPGAAGRHYVTLAELLVRLGGHGLGLTWKALLFDEQPHPAFARMVREATGAGIPTLELLAMEAPHLQAVDADFEGYAGGELKVTLREFDSSSWDVRTTDPWILSELRRHYPDARPLTADEWDATN
ncbi:hypothetical protein ACFCZ6_09190 [Streptomyces hydrogenans]|uniref:hypothetical protein n=1 Tax=Streptomyces hydrogenans TaxID=1873719 RepID=UPI0035D9A970